jgi:hypothetical protein
MLSLPPARADHNRRQPDYADGASRMVRLIAEHEADRHRRRFMHQSDNRLRTVADARRFAETIDYRNLHPRQSESTWRDHAWNAAGIVMIVASMVLAAVALSRHLKAWTTNRAATQQSIGAEG